MFLFYTNYSIENIIIIKNQYVYNYCIICYIILYYKFYGIKVMRMKEKYTVENLEKLLDSIPYGVALQDENYKFLFINKSFCNNINKKKRGYNW